MRGMMGLVMAKQPKEGSKAAMRAFRKSGSMVVTCYGDHTAKVHRLRITVTDVLSLFRTLSPKTPRDREPR